MSKQSHILSLFLILIISLIPLLISAYFFISNVSFYSYEAAKYDVNMQFPQVNMGEYHKSVLDYLFSYSNNAEMPNTIPLNSKEISHMQDVKRLFGAINFISIVLLIAGITICIILFNSHKKEKKEFKKIIFKTLFFSGLISLLMEFITGILSFFLFEDMFKMFHKIFFSEGTWMFYLSDNIIKIYPEGFFSDITVAIFITGILLSGIISVIGFIMIKKLNYNNDNNHNTNHNKDNIKKKKLNNSKSIK